MVMRVRPRFLGVLALALFTAAHTGCVASLVYFPDKEIRPVPVQLGLSPQWVFFETQDRIRLSAWYLFERANPPKQFLESRGRHNSGFHDSLPAYEAGLDAFFAKYLGP